MNNNASIEFIARIRRCGDSYVITVPKKLVELYHLQKRVVKVRIEALVV